MEGCRVPTKVVVVDDDEVDRFLIKEAFSNNCNCPNLHFLQDGVELLENLDSKDSVQPSLIFFDLNMPRMNGLEVLQNLKADNNHKDIPIVIFTTSEDEDNIAKSYCKGASSFIRKPKDFNELQHIINVIGSYWCEVVLLP